jgi:serine/threonine protein phosphatase PrpC
VIRAEWDAIVQEQNRLISSYGTRSGIRLGTTVVAMLITQNRYYILNVGDSRAYELSRELRVLTQDQTVVAREVAQGLLTEAQAQTDPRRSVLLQCVGASDAVAPDFFFGTPLTGAVYMLCSDGFRHEITPAEILEGLRPDRLTNEQAMRSAAAALIELNKQRWERDNITVALVRTY